MQPNTNKPIARVFSPNANAMANANANAGLATRTLPTKPIAVSPAPAIKPPVLPSYKKGGIVKKTGPALVHKGERVIPVSSRQSTSDGYMTKGITRGAKMPAPKKDDLQIA